LDAQALNQAEQEFSNSPVILVLGNALSMPFTDHYFDTVTMSNALHHIEILPELFAETKRVCRQKGLIVVNEMLNENHPHHQETYMLYHRFIAEVDNQSGHYHREPFTEKELMAIIRQSGLQLVESFIHEEVTGNMLNRDEIAVFEERLKRKILLLRGTDYYYFYENKAREIVNRLNNTGVHRPRHITFFLKPV
jgi:SAM-dependent methyltransferase